MDRLQDKKVLIYSHDSFGLGHLRRCRTIAHSLVDTYKGLSVMIISGSPVISQFDFKSRVSFICVPGVVKLRNGDYTSLGEHVDIRETLAMRSSMIQHTAEAFAPDIFIVDKEPLGLRGEVESTLRWLKLRGAVNILGLRDVMDDAESLHEEWERKHAVPAIENLYDEIWIYGTRHLGNPIKGIDITEGTKNKMRYLGYLKRQVPEMIAMTKPAKSSPYLLITPGGGGDGEMLVDWVIRAYEHEKGGALMHGVIVLGPFMSVDLQNAFSKRIRKLGNLEVRIFDNQIEHLMSKATGVVAMGGYNTFCEILSFDKPAVIVPRESPRMEQRIRADYAQKYDLATLLPIADYDQTLKMLNALEHLPAQSKPSKSGLDNPLLGLENINNRVSELLLQD